MMCVCYYYYLDIKTITITAAVAITSSSMLLDDYFYFMRKLHLDTQFIEYIYLKTKLGNPSQAITNS